MITVDGQEVVNFSTPDAFYLNGVNFHYATPTHCAKALETVYNERNSGSLTEKGELSKYDFTYCCYAYLHLSIDEAINHESPIINMFAVLDKRLGKRRLLRLSEQEQNLHPLVRYFLKIRLESYNDSKQKR